jgi:hypothetical protein
MEGRWREDGGKMQGWRENAGEIEGRWREDGGRQGWREGAGEMEGTWREDGGDTEIGGREGNLKRALGLVRSIILVSTYINGFLGIRYANDSY